MEPHIVFFIEHFKVELIYIEVFFVKIVEYFIKSTLATIG